MNIKIVSLSGQKGSGSRLCKEIEIQGGENLPQTIRSLLEKRTGRSSVYIFPEGELLDEETAEARFEKVSQLVMKVGDINRCILQPIMAVPPGGNKMRPAIHAAFP